MDIMSIPGRATVEQAAASLGVSRHQAIELIHNGSLSAERTAGGVFLIDAKSLERLKIIRRGNGRPWKQETAWAALWMLSGLDVPWIDSHQRRRIEVRLEQITADDLVWDARKRADTLRVRISESFIDEARRSLVLTGIGAAATSDFGLVGEQRTLQGYITDTRLNEFINSYHAVEAQSSNAELHVVTNAPTDIASLEKMPIAVIAVDLAASLDTRERKAGLMKLRELLNARR